MQLISIFPKKEWYVNDTLAIQPNRHWQSTSYDFEVNCLLKRIESSCLKRSERSERLKNERWSTTYLITFFIRVQLIRIFPNKGWNFNNTLAIQQNCLWQSTSYDFEVNCLLKRIESSRVKRSERLKNERGLKIEMKFAPGHKLSKEQNSFRWKS